MFVVLVQPTTGMSSLTVRNTGGRVLVSNSADIAKDIRVS